jgi:hypothetical protein
MKASISIAVVGLCLASLQAAAQPPLSLRLSDEVIHKAVRDTLAENPGGPTPQSRKTVSADRYEKFARGFSKAEKPGCLGPDALKFQPNHKVVKIGGTLWDARADGPFALPFWAAAIVRGKCH